jgi:hypothetical protein
MAVEWSASETGGRIEALQGDALQLAWSHMPLANPAGGEKFAASAFLHPLRTPSGFEWTHAQPADHRHHLGVWWPWKFIEVGGKRYNCWEIQEGQGAHVAGRVETINAGPDALEWVFHNEVRVRKPGENAGMPITDGTAVIAETARVRIARLAADANVTDISLRQRALDAPVKIMRNHYSGFSWRGTAAWNQANSRMLTSEGKGRDDANGTPARWLLVSGPSPSGEATVLIMSRAAVLAGEPERLRVWASNMHHGEPFVNFNPVLGRDLQLDDATPAVSNRQYRIIAADRPIDADEAETLWKQWNDHQKTSPETP